MTGMFCDLDRSQPDGEEPTGPTSGAQGTRHDRLVAALQTGVRGGRFHGWLGVLQDLIAYRLAKASFSDATDEFHCLFARFVSASEGRRCLCLRFDTDQEIELGPNWMTLSLDQVQRRAGENGELSIDIENEYYDAVFCTGLERVSHPASLVAELRRVLKRAGQIWVQAPLGGPYVPAGEQGPAEYWRFTPHALQSLMEPFDEILCSVYLPSRSSLRTHSYFFGLNPAPEPKDFTEWGEAAELAGWPTEEPISCQFQGIRT